jgi:hypothetical protein
MLEYRVVPTADFRRDAGKNEPLADQRLKGKVH